MRRVIVRVLPVPAPASTHTGPRGAVTAARCSSSRPDPSVERAHRTILTAPGMTVTGQPLVDQGMAQVTMYSTTWCGYCRRLKIQLDQAGIAYDEVDIERDPDAATFVEGVNGGNQTVPTVIASPTARR